MKWFLRFFGWAVLLALPCWFLYEPWQRGLALAVNPILAAFGSPASYKLVDVGSPFEIGLFAALCLSSRRAPRRVRRLALLTGIPSLMVLEVVLVSIALGIISTRPSNTDPLLRVGFYLTDTIPWLSAPLLWTLWLGAWELPRNLGEWPGKRP